MQNTHKISILHQNLQQIEPINSKKSSNLHEKKNPPPSVFGHNFQSQPLTTTIGHFGQSSHSPPQAHGWELMMWTLSISWSNPMTKTHGWRPMAIPTCCWYLNINLRSQTQEKKNPKKLKIKKERYKQKHTHQEKERKSMDLKRKKKKKDTNTHQERGERKSWIWKEWRKINIQTTNTTHKLRERVKTFRVCLVGHFKQLFEYFKHTYTFFYTFFTHMYIKNTQTTLLKLLYQTPLYESEKWKERRNRKSPWQDIIGIKRKR